MTKIESKNERLKFSRNGSQKTEIWLSRLKTDTNLKNLETKIRKPKTWIFEYIRISSDQKYKVYSYIIKTWWTPNAVRAQALKNGKAESKNWILVTNIKWKPYDENHRFSAWDKIYVKIPSNKETNNSKEEFRCKWWKYFWIDISSHNGSIDLNRFKRWNRAQRDSPNTQERWISLVYIRASDNVSSDKRINEHVNNICKYNKQVNENEKIAIWFYHRLSWSPWKQQADAFIKTYKEQSSKLWWKKLIPMVDVEDWGKNGWVTQAQKNNNREKVRNNTLNWINYIEKELGITPWIYTNNNVNNGFFWNDSRFNKYKKWIARYWWRTPTQADMHQYSDTWKVWWFSGNVDENSTKDVKQFLA